MVGGAPHAEGVGVRGPLLTLARDKVLLGLSIQYIVRAPASYNFSASLQSLPLKELFDDTQKTSNLFSVCFGG